MHGESPVSTYEVVAPLEMADWDTRVSGYTTKCLFHYRDPSTEYVGLWFSAAHAFDVHTFNRLLQSVRQERLQREGGVCIIATHVADRFVQNRQVSRETQRLLELLRDRDGWFVPVSTLLDYLRAEGFGRSISSFERRWIVLRWFFSAIHGGVAH